MAKHYRVYKLRTNAGGFIKATDIEAADDKAAMAVATDELDCPICEVWQGAKKVGAIKEE